MWWEDTKHFLKGLGIGFEYVLAGLFGALASVSKDKQMTFLEKFISIIVGGAVANYLTPLLVDWMKAGENTQYGIAFILGYTGLKSVEWIIDKFKSKLEKK